jgi:hypothetical protein
MNETWLPVTVTENYEVSDFGRVRSWRIWGALPGCYRNSGGTVGRAKSPRMLSQRTNRYGYRAVSLMVDGRLKYFVVHRLVAMAFIGPPPPGKNEVRHLDGDPANNVPGNLAWGDQQDNANDKVGHGRSLKGTKYPLAKLDDEKVRQAVALHEQGLTYEQIGTRLGAGPGAIGRIIRGEGWTHVTLIGSQG